LGNLIGCDSLDKTKLRPTFLTGLKPFEKSNGTKESKTQAMKKLLIIFAAAFAFATLQSCTGGQKACGAYAKKDLPAEQPAPKEINS
jgi:hypothetical protein